MAEQPESTPSTRQERGERRRGYRRRTAVIAAVVAALVAVATGGVWWAVSDDGQGTAVDPGTYVDPSDIERSTSPSATSSGSSRSSSSSASSSSPSSSSATSSSGSAAPAGSAPDGQPTRVQVTSGGQDVIDASLQATYLDAQNVLAPPFGVAGWYAEEGWPKPGHQGSSILVGHINQGGEPDVFWNLPQVKVGDVVTVTYGSGSTVKFKITRSEAASKAAVPQDDSIWDHDAAQPQLRLITCDPTTPLEGGHYEGNWVVWADEMVA